MAPLGFREGPEESADFSKLPLSLRPLEVFLESQLLLDWHGVIPCREDERQRWLPAAGSLLAGVLEHAKKIIPLRRHRHQTVVGGAAVPEGIECFIRLAHEWTVLEVITRLALRKSPVRLWFL